MGLPVDEDFFELALVVDNLLAIGLSTPAWADFLGVAADFSAES